MITEIAEFLAAPVVSGVVGVIGGYLNKRQELKAIEQQNAHALAMEKSKRETAITVSKLSVEEAKVVGSLRVEEINAQSFRESQKTISKVGDSIRAIVRPLILAATGYMVYINLEAAEKIVSKAGGISQESAGQLYSTSVVAMLSLFTMACGWYFGERTSKITDKFMATLK